MSEILRELRGIVKDFDGIRALGDVSFALQLPFLNRTAMGRQVVTVVGNEPAARLSGISIIWIELSA